MPEPGEILTVGQVRNILAQLRSAADDLDARLEGRPDHEMLPPLPVRVPWPWPDPPFPPAGGPCWPNPA